MKIEMFFVLYFFYYNKKVIINGQFRRFDCLVRKFLNKLVRIEVIEIKEEYFKI